MKPEEKLHLFCLPDCRLRICPAYNDQIIACLQRFHRLLIPVGIYGNLCAVQKYSVNPLQPGRPEMLQPFLQSLCRHLADRFFGVIQNISIISQTGNPGMRRLQGFQHFINILQHGIRSPITLLGIRFQCFCQNVLDQFFHICWNIQFLYVFAGKVILVIFISKTGQKLITVAGSCEKIQKQVAHAVQIRLFSQTELFVLATKDPGNLRRAVAQ